MSQQSEYIVIRRTDLESHQILLSEIYRHLSKIGKKPLECLVVEADQPQYALVQALLRDGIQFPTGTTITNVVTMQGAGDVIRALHEIIQASSMLAESDDSRAARGRLFKLVDAITESVAVK